MAIDPETGLVISYNFLWAHQHVRGEEEGRKARPACIVVPITGRQDDVVLFPLTTKQPGPDSLAIRVPEIERRRLKLKDRGSSWILLDEGNRDLLPGSYHIEPISHDPVVFAYGRLSKAFMAQLLRVLAEAIRARRVKVVPRKR